MRIHSKIITATDIHRATENLPGVYATTSEHGSRTHGTAFEVSLEGNGYAGAPASRHSQAPQLGHNQRTRATLLEMLSLPEVCIK